MRADVRLKRGLVAVGLALVVAATAGCGGSSPDTIRIGIFGDCHGPFTAGHERDVAGAELAFIRRGARRHGSKPSDGIDSIVVAGKRVELVIGCDFFGSFTSVLAAERRLVEQEGVDVLITSGSPADGLVMPQYPPYQRSVAFISNALGPEPEQPNVFRVAPNFRQGSAGLGVYAYRTLGWRKAVTLGEDDALGYPLVAGFVAEFCSLGGRVLKRLWAPATLADWTREVGRIPKDADGVAFMNGIIGTKSFFDAYKRIHPDLAHHVVMSATAIAGARSNDQPLADLTGITAGGFIPFTSAGPAWDRYVHDFRAAFPEIRDDIAIPNDIYSFDAVELTLASIERVHGDMSHGERRFMAALTSVRAQTPLGTLRLDRTRNAIAANFLIRVEKTSKGTLVPRTVATFPNVEKTFGGYFTTHSPADSRTQPVCRKGHVPPWAR